MLTQNSSARVSISTKIEKIQNIFIDLLTKNGAPQHFQRSDIANCYQTNSILNLLIYKGLIYCLICVQFVQCLDLCGFVRITQDLSTKLSTENVGKRLQVYKSST